MSEGLNHWTGIGNLVADGELRYTQGNQGVLSFRIAANESWYDSASKARKERVEFVPIVVWGKRGEALSKILSKGKQVCVEGRLQTRSWDDKNGVKRYVTEIVASNIILLGGRGEKSTADNADRQNGSADVGGYGQQQQQLGGVDDDFGDIPF